MSRNVTFVGGPLDLTRAAVDHDRRQHLVPVSQHPVGIGLREGEYVPSDTYRLGLAAYDIKSVFDRDGREVFVGIFTGFKQKPRKRTFPFGGGVHDEYPECDRPGRTPCGYA